MFRRKSWAPRRKKNPDESPQSCPSLASDSSDLSRTWADIQLRTSSLDINGLLSAVNTNMGYQSDDDTESIQASPVLESHAGFDPLNFKEEVRPQSFLRQADTEPKTATPTLTAREGSLGRAPAAMAAKPNPLGQPSGPQPRPVSGPVTGTSSVLAQRLPTLVEKPGTINFSKQAPAPISFESDDEDNEDEELPFATTRKMASTGMARTVLPEISTGIVMTNDKFQVYRKSLNSLDMLNRQNSLISTAASDDDEEDEDEEDEESTRNDRLRKQVVALARQQQEAHLSVHRQKMNKMVGGELTNSTTFDQVAQDDDDIMEDVPLSILRAHGFPKTVKKPQTGHQTNSNSPDMPGFDSTTAAGFGAVSYPGTPAPAGRSPLLASSNRLTQQLPPIFRDGNTFTGGKGLVGEIAREEEAKRNRIGRSSTQPTIDGGIPYVDSRQSIAPMAARNSDPMLHDIRMQMQQMSEMQYQLMQMASGGGPAPDSASIRYSRAPSIRSFGGGPHGGGPHGGGPHGGGPHGGPHGYPSPIPFSPTFNQHTVSARQSIQDLQSYRARPVRQSQREEEEDEDEAWRKFAEKRQGLKSQWIAAE